MIKYVIKRIISIIPVIIVVAILIFSMLYITPGDPAIVLLGDNATPEQIEAVHQRLGLDKPYVIQLLIFLKSLFINFDLGKSYLHGNSVMEEFLNRLPNTAIIAGFVCLLQILLAIPLGVTAATHHNRWQDRFCIFLAMVGTSIPNFWLGLLLILFFGQFLRILPTFGVQHWYSYILPCTACAFQGLAGIARQTRSQMLDVIRSDYIVTARAKGVTERSILYTHALQNALIPVVTGIGTQFGRNLGGTVIIETVFTIPGVGYYLIQAVNNRDYPVVRGVVVILSIMFSLIMLLVDIVYAYIDPRIKARYEGQQKRRIKKDV
jgi:peptide/nickel transport system permease protein